MKRIIHGFSRGLSLAELLIVVTIAALLCVLSVPLLGAVQNSWKLRKERQRIRATLENLIVLSFELQRESTFLVSEGSYHARGALLVDAEIASDIGISSSPSKLSFYPSGAATPGSIRLSLNGRTCVITISLRGRISESCAT